MKIIYGITKSNFGGAQRYVFDLATHAHKEGHEVIVLSGGEGALTEKLKERSIRVITLPSLKRDISLESELESFKFIYNTLKVEKPDVFHTNSSKMGGLGNLAARAAGVKKIIFTAHGYAFNEPRPWWQRFAIKIFVWLTILLSHYTICVSHKTRARVLSWPGIYFKLIPIHNGIHNFPLLSHSEARQKLELPANKLVVGTLAELHKIKGLDILLKAWQHFCEKHEAELVIMGTGEERENLEKLAQELEIADTVKFKGYVDDAKQYLAGFDIFVLASRSENLPYALLEAGLAGLPVVATRVGGVPEIIVTGATGILVEKENPHELFSSLLLLAESKEVRKRLGDALQEKVVREFTLQKMLHDTLKVYE